MSVTNGQAADQTTFNNAFASKQSDNTLDGIQSLEHPTSGGNIANLQQTVNDNTDNIATNTADIATQGTDISNLQNDVTDLELETTDLRTLTGTSAPAVDLGTFTGSVITDNSQIKPALQELENEVELKIDLTEKGAANGVAELDAGGVVPLAQLPSSIVGSLNYQGTWNASTNSPSLSSGVGTKGYYYVVSVAGSTSLDGISSWAIGDWAVYNGTAWEKIDNSEQVTSVNGQTGIVVLDTDDVAEAANLYYTEGRVSANSSVVANTAKVSADGSINTHSDVDTVTNAPNVDDALVWDGSNWVPGEVAASGGGGDKNYITNSGAETDTAGWATYQDAAQSSPVNGDSGSPTVTLTRSTTDPLSGVASFIFTKDAANRQGEGASYDFTIDSSDKARVLDVSFDFLVNSGTFVAGNSTSDSDITVWIFDITNSRLIEPSSKKLFSSSSTIADKYQASFQTSSDSVSYRLIIHVASTSAVAYSLKIDSVAVSPSRYVFGTPVTDWSSYTPTFTGFGTPTSVAFRSRRVGDSTEIVGSFVTGTVSAVAATFTLPTGQTFDSAKQNVTTLCGHLSQGNSSATLFHYSIMTPSANGSAVMQIGVQTSSTTQINATLGTSFGSTSTVHVRCQVPITGWASSVQMSDRADVRAVSASYAVSGSQSISGYTDISVFTTRYNDSHSAFNTANATYTIPVSGTYKCSHNLYFAVTSTTANQYNSRWTINGSTVIEGDIYSTVSTTSSYPRLAHSFIYDFRSGDTIKLQASSPASRTLINTGGTNVISFEKISGPAAISATESIGFTANTSTTAATTSAPFVFSNELTDTHSWYNSSTGVATIPASGLFLINWHVYSNAASWISNLYINGVSSGESTEGTASNATSGTVLRRFSAGDTIEIRPSANRTASGGAGATRFSAVRMGL